MLTVKIMIIYKITNLINQKVYIGLSTRTLQERWKDYIKDIKYSNLSKSSYRPIVAALQKYGIENFTIVELYSNIESKEEMDKLEIQEIAFYNACNPKYGYNIELGGNGIGKHSEQTKKKIGEAQIGAKNHMYGIKGKENHSSKPIIDITTGIIYDSVTIATEQLGLEHKCLTKIAACARGERASAYKHIFRYLDKNNVPIYVNIPLNQKIINPIRNDNTGIIYNTIKEAAKDLNASPSYLGKVISGKQLNSNYHFTKLPSKEILVPKYCKIYELVLDKYKYLINTVPSPETERCNDYPERELDHGEIPDSEAQSTLPNNVEGKEIV